MKLTKRLNAVALALPGLIASQAGATWIPTGVTSGDPFHYRSDSSGFTAADFTGGVPTIIYYYNQGLHWDNTTQYLPGSPGTTPALVTAYTESANWTEIDWKTGKSYIQDNNGTQGHSYGEVHH